MREIYIFSEKITDKALNDLFENSIYPKIKNLDLDIDVKTDLEELKRIFKDDLKLSDEDTSVMILQESDIDTAAFNAVYSSPGRYTPATIEGKAGFVAMTESTAEQITLARLILAIYKRLEGARPSQSPEPESIRTNRITQYNTRNVEIKYLENFSTVATISFLNRCADVIDSWLKENPDGKITPSQLIDIWYLGKPSPTKIEMLEDLISLLNNTDCIIEHRTDKYSNTFKGKLFNIVTYTRTLKVNGATVDKYYKFRCQSLIGEYADTAEDIVTTTIPILKPRKGKKATNYFIICSYFISIAAKQKTKLSMKELYEKAGATEKKGRYDVRQTAKDIVNTYYDKVRFIDDNAHEIDSGKNDRIYSLIDFSNARPRSQMLEGR